jgi:hypothetical protein
LSKCTCGPGKIDGHTGALEVQLKNLNGATLFESILTHPEESPEAREAPLSPQAGKFMEAPGALAVLDLAAARRRKFGRLSCGAFGVQFTQRILRFGQYPESFLTRDSSICCWPFSALSCL